MQMIILIGVVLECLLLLGLALMKKCTGKAFLVISLITALCCGVVAAVEAGANGDSGSGKLDVRGHVYMAEELLAQGKPEQALKALGQITGTEGETYQAEGLRGLAYNQSGAYFAGAQVLKSETEEDLTALRQLCEQQQKAPEDLASRIRETSLQTLSLSASEKSRYDAELRIRYGGMLEDADSSSTVLARIQAAIGIQNWDEAFTLASSQSEEGNLADAILVSEMYIRDYNHRRLAKEDATFDALLQRITQIQIQLNRIGAEGTDSREYRECYAEYELAQIELNRESALRAANYLSAFYQKNSVYEVAYSLQMAKLMYEANDTAAAEAYLDQIFAGEEPADDQWLAVDIKLLKEAYLNGMGNMENPEFKKLYQQLMGSLYQDAFENVSYTDSFSGFLRLYLQELYSGIYISKPDVSRFPTVKVTVSAAEDISFTADTVVVTDTQETVSNLTIREEEKAAMSVCFVLDRSGSMDGTYIYSARRAIREFAGNMEENAYAALVSFANNARLDCPLSDVTFMVAAQVEKITAYGGTNIASGLVMGAQQLITAEGKRVIILLSDGVDGNKGAMPAALNQLKSEGIIVHTIGLPGCEEEYLANIAEETGGTFFPAVNTNALSAVYEEIRGFIANAYTVTYQVSEEETTERTVSIESTQSLAQSRRAYTADKNAEQYSQINDEQSSDYFRQTGGTMGG